MNNTKKWEFLVACESGNMDLLKEVHKAFPNIGLDKKQLGLEVACSNGNINIVKYIIDNIDNGDLDIDECVRVATKNARINIVTFLIANAFKKNPYICK